MTIVIQPEQAGMRLDAALKQGLPDVSRSKIQKAICQGKCRIGTKPVTDPAAKVTAGQEITLLIKPEEPVPAPVAGELTILYEDDDIAVCAKPAGLAVHPCPSCQEETLVNRLLARFPVLASQGGERPGIAHRLDRDTSGLMIIALTERARLKFADDFANHRIRKTYLALVAGACQQSGSSASPIGRHPHVKTRMAVVREEHGGRPAQSEWRRIWHNDRLSLLAVKIRTGRTHQIRVHLADQGLSIIGDQVYGTKSAAAMAQRQMLHAWKLAFSHPVSGKAMSFILPPPADFFEAIAASAKSTVRVAVTGNQGCGKSSFCHDLEKLGLPVISADQIVDDLYSGKSDATDWIRAHIGEDAIAGDGSVAKPALFAILQTKPELKRELETVVHGLVLDRIEKFWASQSGLATIAEIPLYFESGYASLIRPRPFVVGVSCPREKRWQRIAATRGWSQDKIETMEAWQWPEERKMAACDLVVQNDADADELVQEAKKFTSLLAEREAARIEYLIARLKAVCAGQTDLRQPRNPDNMTGSAAGSDFSSHPPI